MTSVRDCLRRWGSSFYTCKRLHEEIKEFELLIEAARGTGGIVYDGMPHSSTPGNPTENKALRAMQIEKEYQSYIDCRYKQLEEELRYQKAIDDAVSGLSTFQRKVVQLRYKDGYSWEQVSVETNRTSDWIRHIDIEIIDNIAKEIIKTTQKNT